MITVIKLLGVERSATTYCQWLMINNFNNIIMLVAALGSKHSLLADYFYKVDWVNGTNTLETDHIKNITKSLKNEIGVHWQKNRGIPWTCSPGCSSQCSHTSPNAEKHIQKALEESSMKFILCTKNPYSWFLSSIARFRQKGKSLSREDLIKARVGGWINRNISWLKFKNKNEGAFFIFKYEDVLADKKKILDQVKEKFNLAQTGKEYAEMERYFLSSGAITAKTFDRTYYTKKSYMKKISQSDKKVFRKILPVDLMKELGYEVL